MSDYPKETKPFFNSNDQEIDSNSDNLKREKLSITADQNYQFCKMHGHNIIKTPTLGLGTEICTNCCIGYIFTKDRGYGFCRVPPKIRDIIQNSV